MGVILEQPMNTGSVYRALLDRVNGKQLAKVSKETRIECRDSIFTRPMSLLSSVKALGRKVTQLLAILI